MEKPQFVLIPCRQCTATTLVVGDRRRPTMCARCRAPFDPVSATFGTRTDVPPEGRVPAPAPEI